MKKFHAVIFFLLVIILPTHCLHAADDINIALAMWGAKAVASSEFGPDYRAVNVLDGKWTSREHHKWNSQLNAAPHWLLIDFGREVTVHRIVVRHEGVYGGGETFNTSDFRLQAGDTPDGPWREIVEPVRDNTENVSDFAFTPVRMKYLRLMIEKGERNANDYARIFEVEAYARTAGLFGAMMHLSALDHVKRESDGKYEIGARVDIVFPPSVPGDAAFLVCQEGKALFSVKKGDAFGSHECWLPVPESDDGVGKVELVMRSGSRDQVLGKTEYRGTKPGYFADGSVHVISSSHQDIGWMDAPEKCIIDRDRLVITPALERMRENPAFRFVMESTMNLMEYLDRHPGRKDEIVRYTKEGCFAWGATYNQPYESMYGGEALVRQTYLGRRWLKKNLPGCDTRVAWSPDVPGRAMQMPQILAKSDIPYLVMSRHKEGLFRWGSPDGSTVIAYSPGHYHASGEIFRKGIERGDDHTTIVQKTKSFEEVVPSLYPVLVEKETYYNAWNLPPDLGIISSTDFSGPVDFDDLFAQWNKAVVEGIDNKGGKTFAMPRLTYATAGSFLDAVTRGNPMLETIIGERPNVWLYIHGPTHHRALTTGREAWRTLTAVETFAAMNALVSGNFDSYPSKRLETAWMNAIFPDHGWGG